MNLVFLDVDGVLNSTRSAVALGTYQILDPIAVRLMAKLCEEGPAKIVVSSTWRLGHPTLESLQNNLAEADTCATCGMSELPRGVPLPKDLKGHSYTHDFQPGKCTCGHDRIVGGEG